MSRAPSPLAALVLAPIVLVGCSLIGLADYTVTSCTFDPSRPLLDPCNALNPRCDTAPCPCTIMQCDVSTGRCAQRTRDLDQDGDPDPECGGHDCDDLDARVSSKQTEHSCDLRDNDCNGHVDEGWLAAGEPALTLTPPQTAARLADPSMTTAYASTKADRASLVVGEVLTYKDPRPFGGTQCVGLTPDDSGPVGDGCVFEVPGVDPAQPYVIVLPTFPPISGLAYVSKFGVTSCDAVSVTMSAGSSTQYACPGGKDASLPSIAPWTKHLAGYTYYVKPIDRGSCPQTAELHFAFFTNEGSPFDVVLTPRSTSLRPAAILNTQHDGARDAPLLVAAPDDDRGVAFWSVQNRAMYETPVVTPIATPQDVQMTMARARSVAMAMDPVNSQNLAIVAEIDCPPKQKIVLVVANVVRGVGGVVEIAFNTTTTVGTGGSNVASPNVIATTYAGRREWRVTWLDDGDVQVRRFDERGISIDAGFSTHATDAVAAAPGLATVVQAHGTSSIQSVPVTCRAP